METALSRQGMAGLLRAMVIPRYLSPPEDPLCLVEDAGSALRDAQNTDQKGQDTLLVLLAGCAILEAPPNPQQEQEFLKRCSGDAAEFFRHAFAEDARAAHWLKINTGADTLEGLA